MMPIAAIATCLLVSRVVGVERIAQEVEPDGQRFRRKPVFNFMIRWLCPIFAAIILAARWQMPLAGSPCKLKTAFPAAERKFLTVKAG